MLVTQVLRSKGSDVVTVGPATTVRELLAVLAEHRIGAVVVVDDAGGVLGIMSERDVVRSLHHDGEAALERPVETLMTRAVVACARDTSVEELMATMTQRRIRHVPVLDGDALVGIVSIGDAVKCRIGELESERDGFVAYIGG